jgi:hypothetical protein
MLGLAQHNIFLVLLGLLCWVGAYWQLSTVGSRAIGDVVTLILIGIPALIALVGLIETVVKLFEKEWGEAGVFAVVTVVAGVFFYIAYWRKKEHRKLIKKRKLLSNRPGNIAKKLGLLIGGAILTLGVVGAGIFAGWQLIDGSLLLGGISAGVGLVLGVLCHQPEAEGNFLKKWYSALVEGNSDGADEEPERSASQPSTHVAIRES